MTTLSAQNQEPCAYVGARAEQHQLGRQQGSGTQRPAPITRPGSVFRGSALSLLSDQVVTRRATAPGKTMAPDLAPVRVILKLQAFWGLANADMLRACGLPPDDTDAFQQSLARHFRLVDVKARLRSLVAIRGRLSALFGGDRDRERRWLTTPWVRLGDQAPLALLVSDQIADLFEVEAVVRELAGG
jgi:uncharacterized protein (DUF2384 family)